MRKNAYKKLHWRTPESTPAIFASWGDFAEQLKACEPCHDKRLNMEPATPIMKYQGLKSDCPVSNGFTRDLPFSAIIRPSNKSFRGNFISSRIRITISTTLLKNDWKKSVTNIAICPPINVK